MAPPPHYRFSQSAEDYLKAVFKLQTRERAVSTTRLADAVGVSPAAVTKAVKQLAEQGLIHHAPYRGVTLSSTGRSAALAVIRHHRLLELFLHNVLGYRWDEVHDEAERLEHQISEKFEDCIDRLLGHPEFDPHGEPIPTLDGRLAPEPGNPLADCEIGATVVVVRVHDGGPAVLQYLARVKLRPKPVVEVLDKQPFNGPLALRVDSRPQTIGRELAGCVFVRPLSNGPGARGSAARRRSRPRSSRGVG